MTFAARLFRGFMFLSPYPVNKETMSIINEIILILILVLINALLAMSEAALVASRKVRLQQQANEGNKSSELALKLLKDPNIFLSTVQIGITLIGILLGVFSGSSPSGWVNWFRSDLGLPARKRLRRLWRGPCSLFRRHFHL